MKKLLPLLLIVCSVGTLQARSKKTHVKLDTVYNNYHGPTTVASFSNHRLITAYVLCPTEEKTFNTKLPLKSDTLQKDGIYVGTRMGVVKITEDNGVMRFQRFSATEDKLFGQRTMKLRDTFSLNINKDGSISIK
jgi:hypothetical protein